VTSTLSGVPAGEPPGGRLNARLLDRAGRIGVNEPSRGRGPGRREAAPGVEPSLLDGVLGLLAVAQHVVGEPERGLGRGL
jgi:hypothetical protein